MNAPYRIHPQNKDFTWTDAPDGGLRRVTADQKKQFDEQGYFILHGAFTEAELDTVEAAIDPLEHQHELAIRAKEEGREGISSADAITFTGEIVAIADAADRSPRTRPSRACCHDLIGPDVRLYWDQSVYKKSDKPQEFPWHQDNGYTFIEPQQYLTFWIPLVDVDVENGCPWIAPGLHKLGTLDHWVTPIGLKCLDEVEDAVPAPAKRGDASTRAASRTAPARTSRKRRSRSCNMRPTAPKRGPGKARAFRRPIPTASSRS